MSTFAARVRTARLAVCALLLALWAFQPAADALLQRVWTCLRASPVFAWDTFEPALAVSSFALWIFCFNRPTLFFAPAYVRQHRVGGPGLRVRKGAPSAAARWELVGVAAYLAPLLALDALFPRRQLPAAAPGAFRLLGEVAAAVGVYDALFFAGHTALHRVPWLYRRLHQRHHAAPVEPVTTVDVSLGEQLLLVGCSVVALNIVRAHPLSRAVYNVALTYLLTELHAGLDMPWMLSNVVPGGLVAGARQHAVHHSSPDVWHGKFLTVWDRVMGTAASGG